MADLASLDRAAVLAYEAQAKRILSDPARLRNVHGAAFKAQAVQDRLMTLCEVARTMIPSDGCCINLVTDEDQITVAADQSTSVDEIHGSLDYSYCLYVVAERAEFRVEHAEDHALVCTSKATIEGLVRAYLGMPVIVHGYAVGSMCVWSTENRDWKPSEVTLLTSLAAVASDTLNWDIPS